MRVPLTAGSSSCAVTYSAHRLRRPPTIEPGASLGTWRARRAITLSYTRLRLLSQNLPLLNRCDSRLDNCSALDPSLHSRMTPVRHEVEASSFCTTTSKQDGATPGRTNAPPASNAPLNQAVAPPAVRLPLGACFNCGHTGHFA